MKKIVVLAVTILCVFSATAQDQKFGITFGGFVKNDFFFDSRQTVSIREGHFLLYPAAILKDSNGKDINAKSSFNFLSIQTRLSGKITGPDAFGAKTSGIIEADFFGNENAAFIDNNGFRLRHATAKLNWTKTELLFGQFWHPMFITASFPGVISFNTGVPFQPFSRNPQVRITHKLGKLSLIAALCAQRDFASPGGSTALRNSTQPEAHLQFQYYTKNDSLKKEFLIGAGVGYKTITPRLNSEISTTTPAKYEIDTTTTPWTVKVTNASTSTKKFVVDESVSGLSATAFLKIKIPALTFKLHGVYGQNLFDLTMLGGYAVDTITDAITGLQEYNPTNTVSGWIDVNTNGEKIQYGLFAGYTKNLGVNKNIMASSIASISNTTRGYNISSVYRVSPRVVFISGKFSLATEIEMTTAAYATKNAGGAMNIDKKGKVTESENVTNYRLLFSAIYNF